MAHRFKGPKKYADLDAAVLAMRASPAGPHYPGEKHYWNGEYRWTCAGCEYWTGYGSRTKTNKQIKVHCLAKNADETTHAAYPTTDKKED